MDLLNQVWELAEQKDTTINKKLYNWLTHDNLSNIVLDNNIFWFELTTRYTKMPNYIHDYLIKILEKQGYIYLSNIKEIS